MSTILVYRLDGKPVNLTALCRAHGWPRKIVTRVLRERDDLTTDELRAVIVDHRAQPIRRVTAAERRHGLTKQARHSLFNASCHY